jgi:hypothetical protein
MYGSIYAMPTSQKRILERDGGKRFLRQDVSCDEESFQQLSSFVSKASREIGHLIESKSSFSLKQAISDSTSLLLMANFLAESDDSIPATPNDMIDAVIKAALDKCARNILPETSETQLVGFQLEKDTQIESALKELGDAVGMLRAEVCEIATVGGTSGGS